MAEVIPEFNLVQNIKDCGQAMVDNAERIANDYRYLKGLIITCYVDRREEYPFIEVSSEFIPENVIKRCY